MNLCDVLRSKFGTYGLPEDDFYRIYGAWRHEPCYVNGQMVAIALTDGPEIHLALLREPVPQFRKVLGDAARRTLADHGHMTTTVAHDDEPSRKFIERIGFRKTGEVAIGNTYRIESSDWRY
jgi:hypothetical protein